MTRCGTREVCLSSRLAAYGPYAPQSTYRRRVSSLTCSESHLEELSPHAIELRSGLASTRTQIEVFPDGPRD